MLEIEFVKWIDGAGAGASFLACYFLGRLVTGMKEIKYDVHRALIRLDRVESVHGLHLQDVNEKVTAIKKDIK